jgi:ABC-2 type transport system ATP-binding protein
MSATPAVEISGCAFSYGRARALDGVSFRVPPGSIFGLLGPNGSGKTTLFRILATLLVPDRGSARLFGIDIAENPIKARRQLGIVFQSQSLDRRLSVEENLVHQGHMYGMRGATLASRIRDVLGKVGLADRQKDRVETLSGGLRRRADLAKGLLHAPKLLLLDEPTEGLQPSIVQEIEELIVSLREQSDTSILLVEQSLDFALAVADHCFLMEKGEIVLEGPTNTLDHNLMRDYLAV